MMAEEVHQEKEVYEDEGRRRSVRRGDVLGE